MMPRIAAHGVGQRHGDAPQRGDRHELAGALYEGGGRIAEHHQGCDQAGGEGEAQSGGQSARLDHFTRKRQRHRADERHRQHAQHAVHQHRRGRLGEVDVVPSEGVGPVHIGGDAGDEVADERAHEEDAQHDGERRA